MHDSLDSAIDIVAVEGAHDSSLSAAIQGVAKRGHRRIQLLQETPELITFELEWDPVVELFFGLPIEFPGEERGRSARRSS